MNKYSRNNKLNAVLTDIENQLLSISDTEADSLEEVRHYMLNFRTESDYNLAQYGNLLVYYGDVYDMYRQAGYKTTDKMTEEQIWKTYRRQVGYVARLIVYIDNHIKPMEL